MTNTLEQVIEIMRSRDFHILEACLVDRQRRVCEVRFTGIDGNVYQNHVQLIGEEGKETIFALECGTA